MKIYGYAHEGQSHETAVPEELAEITLCATPGELRRVSEFLASCAAEMERMDGAYDHVHLGDRMKEFDLASPHFVVAKAE